MKHQAKTLKTKRMKYALVISTIFVFSFAGFAQTNAIEAAFSNLFPNRTLSPNCASPSPTGITSISLLYVLDGEIVSEEFARALPAERIESITVLQGQAATAFWGEQGRNGVVLITTKGFTVGSNEFINPAPLFVVDGVIMDDDFQLSSISPESIQSITVLRDDAAVAQFGERGKRGVIILTTIKQ